MAILLRFKKATAAILDFYIFEILTITAVKKIKLRHHAKFRGDRSNHCWDMAIFRFLQDGGRPPCWIRDAHVWTTHEGDSVVFITVQNLVGIDSVVSIICMLSPVLCRLSSVTLVHPTQPVLIFGNISMAFGTLAISWHPRKILRRSSQRNPSVGEAKRNRGSQI